MKIAPVSLNLNSVTSLSFGKKTKTYNPNEAETDSFSRREDSYTKRYKALMQDANILLQESETKKPPLKRDDIQFLLDIKDGDKFKKIITAPIEITSHHEKYTTNIFFYTDADATKKLIKKLDNKEAAKKLLIARYGYNRDSIMHLVAANDDVKKAKVIRNALSVKEFNKLINAKNNYYLEPEYKGQVKEFVDQFFEEVSKIEQLKKTHDDDGQSCRRYA